MTLNTSADTYRDELAPLYSEDRNGEPRPAYLELWDDAAGWHLTADTDYEAPAMPRAVYEGRWHRWPIAPDLRGSAVAALLTDPDVHAIAERIIAGDAAAARDMALLVTGIDPETGAGSEDDGIGWAPESRVSVIDVGDWLADWTPDPTQTVADAVAEHEAVIEAEGCIVRGDLETVIRERLGDCLLSAADVAALAGVQHATVQAWTERHADFPAPVRTFGSARAWRRSDIEEWLAVPRRPGRPRKNPSIAP